MLLKDAKLEETDTLTTSYVPWIRNVILVPLTEQEMNKPHLYNLKME